MLEKASEAHQFQRWSSYITLYDLNESLCFLSILTSLIKQTVELNCFPCRVVSSKTCRSIIWKRGYGWDWTSLSLISLTFSSDVSWSETSLASENQIHMSCVNLDMKGMMLETPSCQSIDSLHMKSLRARRSRTRSGTNWAKCRMRNVSWTFLLYVNAAIV